MKHFTRWVLMLTIIMAVFVSFPGIANAQFEQQEMSAQDDGDGGPGDPCTDPLEYCPIDGGLYALLAAGVGFGIMRARQARKNAAHTVNL